MKPSISPAALEIKKKQSWSKDLNTKKISVID
jgi:hypothetical protein